MAYDVFRGKMKIFQKKFHIYVFMHFENINKNSEIKSVIQFLIEIAITAIHSQSYVSYQFKCQLDLLFTTKVYQNPVIRQN